MQRALTETSLPDHAAAPRTGLVPAGGQGIALAQVFGWLGGQASRPRRVAQALVAPAAAHLPPRRRAVLVLPFLLLHPGLVPAGFAIPAALGVAAAAIQLALPPAPGPAAPVPSTAGTAQGAAAREAARALDQAEQALAAARRQIEALDEAGDPHAAAAWREGLRQEADRLRQRREAARAALDASRKLLAGQPGSVLALKETTAQPSPEEARATLLRLQVEREHLAAQYVPGYPALRELDRKIAAAKASLEEGRRPSVSRTQEVRNPTLDALGQRAALAQVDLAAVEAQLGEVDRQLAQAEARRAERAAADAGLRDLETRRDALRRDAAVAAAAAAQPAPAPHRALLYAPSWQRILLPAWIGLACGALLAAILWLLQRRALAAASRVRAVVPTEILPPPAWPLAAGPGEGPDLLWHKPGVGPAEPGWDLPPRLRPPVGAGLRWDHQPC